MAWNRKVGIELKTTNSSRSSPPFLANNSTHSFPPWRVWVISTTQFMINISMTTATTHAYRWWTSTPLLIRLMASRESNSQTTIRNSLSYTNWSPYGEAQFHKKIGSLTNWTRKIEDPILIAISPKATNASPASVAF